MNDKIDGEFVNEIPFSGLSLKARYLNTLKEIHIFSPQNLVYGFISIYFKLEIIFKQKHINFFTFK